MSRVRTLRTRKAPEGFDKIEPVLLELEQKMKDAVNESHELKRRNQAQWPIFRIEHQQNRYIYELYYKKKVISRELYDWLVEQNYVNVQLVGKWRKAGYERLCCLKCIQPKDTNYGTTCICRVPSNQLHATPSMYNGRPKNVLLSRQTLKLSPVPLLQHSHSLYRTSPQILRDLAVRFRVLQGGWVARRS